MNKKKQTNEWINKRIAKAGSKEAKKYGKIKTEEEKKHLSKNSSKYWEGKNRSEETKKKISETKKAKGLSELQKKILYKKAYKINTLNNEITAYESTGAASKIENVNQSTISRWCSKNTHKNGFFWTYNEPINN